jgi:hypothetical protein
MKKAFSRLVPLPVFEGKIGKTRVSHYEGRRLYGSTETIQDD